MENQKRRGAVCPRGCPLYFSKKKPTSLCIQTCIPFPTYAFLSLPLQLLDVLSLATSVHEPDLVERALLRPSPRLASRRHIARGPLLPHGSDGRGGAS